jgi:redoxin
LRRENCKRNYLCCLALGFGPNFVGRWPDLQAHIQRSNEYSSYGRKFLKGAECLLPYNCERTGVVVAMVRHLLLRFNRRFHIPNKAAFGRFIPVLLLMAFIPSICPAQRRALDLDGKSVNPLKSDGGRTVVLVFVREDCPISARYAPVIQRISDAHQKDARFYLVFPDKAESPADVRKYLHEFRYSIPALRDPDHSLVKEAGAKVTPEAVVFDTKGALVYRGRIDNLYESFGRSRPAPTTHELEDALQAALTGHALSNKEVTAVGCYISDLQ